MCLPTWFCTWFTWPHCWLTLRRNRTTRICNVLPMSARHGRLSSTPRMDAFPRALSAGCHGYRGASPLWTTNKYAIHHQERGERARGQVQERDAGRAPRCVCCACAFRSIWRTWVALSPWLNGSNRQLHFPRLLTQLIDQMVSVRTLIVKAFANFLPFGFSLWATFY